MVQRLLVDPSKITEGFVEFLWCECVVYSMSVVSRRLGHYEFNRPLLPHVLAVFGLHVQGGKICVCTDGKYRH